MEAELACFGGGRPASFQGCQLDDIALQPSVDRQSIKATAVDGHRCDGQGKAITIVEAPPST